MKGKSLSRVRLLATPWTAAHQAPPSMGFSRQEYWSGVPLPSMYYTHTILFGLHSLIRQDPLQIRQLRHKGLTSDQISRSVVSDSLRPHESQHTRPPCPSPTPGVHSDSRPSSQIRSDEISRSVVSDSLPPHESQHARPPCPSPTPGVHPDSRPSSQ